MKNIHNSKNGVLEHMFDPGLAIGQVVKNGDIVEIFKCGNMGGMRRSKTTNTLVIISDYTKGIYHDKWIGGVLHYTGMGKNGDQDIDWAQNATLAASRKNGVAVYLFEVMDIGEYVYCGRVELVGEPYMDQQPGEDGQERKVWIFPIQPVPNNDVKKPAMFVFEDMEDYVRRGKIIDEEYRKILAEQKKARKKAREERPPVTVAIHPAPPKPVVVAPPELVGKHLKHKSYGEGTVVGVEGAILVVSFNSVGEKKLGYEVCMKNKLVEFF